MAITFEVINGEAWQIEGDRRERCADIAAKTRAVVASLSNDGTRTHGGANAWGEYDASIPMRVHNPNGRVR